MEISNSTPWERKRIRLLRNCRKAWAKEHKILQQMLIHGTPPLELSCRYGLSHEDISNMYQRLLTVVFPWVLEYRQSERGNFRTKHNRHSKLSTGENMIQNEKTPSLPADSKRNDLLKLKLTECGVPLRYRVLKTLHSLDIYTIKDLSETPLFDLLKYRGFGSWCILILYVINYFALWQVVPKLLLLKL